jgi:hypothetical protein
MPLQKPRRPFGNLFRIRRAARRWAATATAFTTATGISPEFRGRHRTVTSELHHTELLFLDEALTLCGLLARAVQRL